MQSTGDEFEFQIHGEPEVCISRRDGDTVLQSITVWEGYLAHIVERIRPGANGWTGFVKPYHAVAGWMEHPTWTDETPDVSLALLEMAVPDCSWEVATRFGSELAALYRTAIENGETVVWKEA